MEEEIVSGLNSRILRWRLVHWPRYTRGTVRSYLPISMHQAMPRRYRGVLPVRTRPSLFVG